MCAEAGVMGGVLKVGKGGKMERRLRCTAGRR